LVAASFSSIMLGRPTINSPFRAECRSNRADLRQERDGSAMVTIPGDDSPPDDWTAMPIVQSAPRRFAKLNPFCEQWRRWDAFCKDSEKNTKPVVDLARPKVEIDCFSSRLTTFGDLGRS